MTYAVTAKGDRLDVELTNGVWTKIMEIKSIPEIGETADKIEATNIDSDIKEYIKGLSDQSDLEFTGNAMPISAPDSNVALLMSMSRDAEYRWRWVSPRLGIQVIWRGEFAYKYGAGEVNSVRDIIITIIPKTRPIESEISSTWTLTYDANEGSGEMTDASSPYDNADTVTTVDCTFTAPDGMTFLHWNTAADNSGSSYDAADSFQIYGNTILYAIWSA